MPPTILIVRPADASRKGDGYKGVFKPEGDRIAAYWRSKGGTVVIEEVDVFLDDEADPSKPPKNFRAVMDERLTRTCAAVRHAGAMGQVFTHVVLLCHGWQRGLQLGLENTPASCERLLKELRTHMTASGTFFLAACSAGKIAGKAVPVAQVLRDACSTNPSLLDVRVLAHQTDGHAVWNPYVRLFSPYVRLLGAGLPGSYVIDPKAPLWSKWSAALKANPKAPRASLRYRFFTMTREEIAEELKP